VIKRRFEARNESEIIPRQLTMPRKEDVANASGKASKRSGKEATIEVERR